MKTCLGIIAGFCILSALFLIGFIMVIQSGKKERVELPPYRLTQDEADRWKTNITVELEKRATRQEIENLAKHLRRKTPHKRERYYIFFRLYNEGSGGLAWATGHFEPSLTVTFLGATIEEYEKSRARPLPKNTEKAWINEFDGTIYSVFKEDGLKIGTRFATGEGLVSELQEITEKEFWYDHLGEGGRIIIEEDGALGFYSKDQRKYSEAQILN